MSRYEGPVFSEQDFRTPLQGNPHSIKKTRFTNYLENQEKKEAIHPEVDHSMHPSTYISNNLMEPSDTMPFLRHNKESFISYRDKETVQDEDAFAAKKKRLQDEKRNISRIQSDEHSYASYKSRRPFQLTEIPEPLKGWNDRKQKEIDYVFITGLLEKESTDLLLFEVSFLEEYESHEKETLQSKDEIHPLHGKAKRAMNRSLLGIMAQESSFDVSDTFTKEPDSEEETVGHSYF